MNHLSRRGALSAAVAAMIGVSALTGCGGAEPGAVEHADAYFVENVKGEARLRAVDIAGWNLASIAVLDGDANSIEDSHLLKAPNDPTKMLVVGKNKKFDLYIVSESGATLEPAEKVDELLTKDFGIVQASSTGEPTATVAHAAGEWIAHDEIFETMKRIVVRDKSGKNEYRVRIPGNEVLYGVRVTEGGAVAVLQATRITFGAPGKEPESIKLDGTNTTYWP